MKTTSDITIKDVANRAKVAVSTVSRVINNLDYVSPKTRDKVLKAADELGYVHNSIAAAMKTGKSKMIVVVIPDLINDLFSAVVQGVEEIVAQKGYYTLVYTTGDRASKEKELFNSALGKMVDGAIVVPAVDDPTYYRDLRVPLVFVDRTLGNIDTVVIDNYKGGYYATKELLQNGHRRIAFINGDKDRDFSIATNRQDGFVAAMNEYKVPVCSEFIRFGHWSQDAGYRAIKDLLSMKDPPTAVFAANSQICIGCLNYMREHNLTAGQDVSLVSFDDSLMAQLNVPPVSVISRPTIEMGHIAAKMLLNKLNAVSNPYARHMLDVELIRRASVKNINGSAEEGT